MAIAWLIIDATFRNLDYSDCGTYDYYNKISIDPTTCLAEQRWSNEITRMLYSAAGLSGLLLFVFNFILPRYRPCGYIVESLLTDQNQRFLPHVSDHCWFSDNKASKRRRTQLLWQPTPNSACGSVRSVTACIWSASSSSIYTTPNCILSTTSTASNAARAEPNRLFGFAAAILAIAGAACYFTTTGTKGVNSESFGIERKRVMIIRSNLSTYRPSLLFHI